MRKRFLRSVRMLAECCHASERLSARRVRELGLTLPQFDIVATLGNTAGMSFKELGEKTLITRGTLTGIVDRLAARGLLECVAAQTDRRGTLVRLTPAGQALFAQVFPRQVAHCGLPFRGYREADFVALEEQLRRLSDALGDEPR